MRDEVDFVRLPSGQGEEEKSSRLDLGSWTWTADVVMDGHGHWTVQQLSA